MLDLQVEIFIFVGIGYLISKLGLFNKQTRKQVTDLVLNIVLPVATAKSFLIKLTPSIMKTTIVVFLVSIGIQGLYFIINKTAYNNQEETKKYHHCRCYFNGCHHCCLRTKRSFQAEILLLR